MANKAITLAQIAHLLDMVEVRCTKIDRRGRYPKTTMIERNRHGAGTDSLPDAHRQFFLAAARPQTAEQAALGRAGAFFRPEDLKDHG